MERVMRNKVEWELFGMTEQDVELLEMIKPVNQ